MNKSLLLMQFANEMSYKYFFYLFWWLASQENEAANKLLSVIFNL